ncbi:L-lactate permease [Aquella oligotrophica]|uniref:L-lactate permease n=1 Tax=Aquella oligotrophica TaxID=2067065 RepID=A0A2I7N3Z5_9NEIS|nr:L-lactate permease [Aquella oligotrophica]AUR51163.1 hypothetical protein CUN60_02215 [Aquella oligotrophica]
MEIFSIIEAMSPIIVCAIAIIFFKKSTIFAALVGLFLAILEATFSKKFNINSNNSIISIISSSCILTFSAVIVIVPGLYLNAILKGQGKLIDLVNWISEFKIDKEKLALILLLGILPALESLTGFGVSLFLGIPIFFKLFEEEKAYKLSMLGMMILPWGTLGLATVVGAGLSGYSIKELGNATSEMSFLIFPIISLISLKIMNKLSLWYIGIIFGMLFSILLHVFNYYGYVEVSAILAGLLTAIIGFLVLKNRKMEGDGLGNSNLFMRLKLISPYLSILLIILITRSINSVHIFLNKLFVIKSGSVSLSIFNSPGIVLLLVSMICYFVNPIKIEHKPLWKRVRIACLSLFCFILLAQTMNQVGMVTTLAKAIQNIGGASSVIILSPLLGVMSGFITGSNLGGNALVMTVQQHIGESLHHGLLFSALQNSAAGHAAFTSLPIIVLIITIAKDVNMNSSTWDIKENHLLKFGLSVLLINYIVLVLSLIFLYSLK